MFQYAFLEKSDIHLRSDNEITIMYAGTQFINLYWKISHLVYDKL